MHHSSRHFTHDTNDKAEETILYIAALLEFFAEKQDLITTGIFQR